MSKTHRKTQTAPAIAQSVAIDETTNTTAIPAPADQPTKPAKEPGTSNLACTIRQFRHNYQVALAPSGKKTANNGDRVAKILLRVPHAVLAAFVYETFGKEYSRLNKGHDRMCCGNIVRAEAKKDNQKVLLWLATQEGEQAESAE